MDASLQQPTSQHAWTGKIYSNGWVDANGGTAAVIEPATGGTLGTIGVATAEDVDRAARSALSARATWAATPFDQRAAVMREAARLLKERAADFNLWNVRECGSIMPKAEWELHATHEQMLMAAALPNPDLNHARAALGALEHLVVQDIFLTETAWLADVVLPATAWPEKTGTVTNTDRMVQLGRKAIEAPGEARSDLGLIQAMASGMGLCWTYPGADDGVAAVYEEMRQAMHGAIAGISWERLQREGSVTYPCLTADDPGQPIMFVDRFPTADGRVRLVPATLVRGAEPPDEEYPLVLITGRQLEHWHTGSMTRRASVLDAIEPVPMASMNGREMARLGLVAGDMVEINSRRGELRCQIRRDDGTPDATVFMPFAYAEAAANLLTNPALDPFGKIPEFKYCAVRVARFS